MQHNSFENYDVYKIPKLDGRSYISICYKNITIKWVLQEFSNTEAFNISEKVLKLTKFTHYAGATRTFYCKRKSDIKTVYKVLYEEYHVKKAKFPCVNLLEVSIHMLNNS